MKLFARAVVTSGPLVARLVNTTAEGEGPFGPAAVNSFGIALVPVSSGGVATLVYEILRADPLVAVTVSGSLAPPSAVLSADAIAPIPRFVEDTPLPAFNIAPCTGGRMTGGGSVFTTGKTRVTHGFQLQTHVRRAPCFEAWRYLCGTSAGMGGDGRRGTGQIWPSVLWRFPVRRAATVGLIVLTMPGASGPGDRRPARALIHWRRGTAQLGPRRPCL